MPEFKLIKEEFSDKFQEWWWTYELEIIFNHQKILKVTITDYPWRKKGREMITKELILRLLEKVNGQILKPIEYKGKKKPYKWQTSYQGKRYRLIFWFEDNSSDWIWVRNCHRIN